MPNRIYRQLAQEAIELIESIHVTSDNPQVKRAASIWLLRYYDLKHMELLKRKNLAPEAEVPSNRALMVPY